MMIWKELKYTRYKNYVYYIYGKYTEDYPTRINGEVLYKEAIETSVKIMNPLGDIVDENSWLDMLLSGKEEFYSQYLIRFRPILKKGIYYELFKQVTEKIIHIEDDYQRILDDWSSYCERIIDESISEHEKEMYEQEVTDGLPDSVFIKYLNK